MKHYDGSLTLEKEFAQAIKDHKCQVIMYAIMRFPELEKHKLLRRTLENLKVEPLEGYEHLTYNQLKAYWIEDDVEERNNNGEEGLYDKVYELCWKRARHTLVDDEPLFEEEN